MSPYISSSGRSTLPPSIIPAKQPIGSRVPSNKGSAFITAEQPHQIDSLSFGEQTVPPDLFDDTGPDEVHHNAVPGYIIGRKIGDGGFSNVHIGYWPARKLKVAVKIVDKKRLIEDPNDETLLRRELRAMRHLEGECSVIRLYASYETAGFFYLVIEYLEGGTVLEYVRKRKTLSKADAARFLGQTAEALRQCHQKQVIHRDVKLENLMLDENGNIKLIDFGLCAFFAPGQRLRVFCGSPSYASPEIIAEREYEGPPVDVWSLGVCFFALLMGFLPFYNTRGKKDINEKIMEGRLGKFSDHILRSSVKGLIEGMLAVNPADRLTLDEVLNHEWLRRYRE
jgi:5'-AMP-activated protein kinase catalytic alpha subunit